MILRWRRWLALVLALVSLLAGVRLYLSSHFVAARVAGKLEKLYGGPVHVGSAAVGARQTVLFDVALFEAGDATQPWLTIDRLEADLSLKDAIGGVTPARVAVHGVTITLRFDAEGHLLTDLPSRRSNAAATLETFPEVVLTGSKVRLVGPMCRQLEFEDVTATLTPGASLYTFNGKGRVATSGDWNVNGWIDARSSQVSLTVRSDGEVAVTQLVLDTLPFVPPATWREVQADGVTPVAATLTFDLANKRRSYSVELQPKNASIHVTAIDLTATVVAGMVTITGGKVALRHLQGQACGGTLVVDGALDFSRPGVDIELAKLAVDDADVRQLPARWSLPRQLEGRLHASCQLSLAVAAGKVQTKGTGTGEVRQARIDGQPTIGPIRLALREVNAATHLGVDVQLAPSDLSTVADTFGTKLPPETGGRVALDAALSLPLDTIFDPTSYRAQGRVDLTDGRVAGLIIPTAKLHWHSDANHILVDSLQAEAFGGVIHGTAELPLKNTEVLPSPRGGEESGARGHLWFHGLKLARLVASESHGTLKGTVDADLNFELDGDDFFPVARGRVVVTDVGWKDQPFAPDLQGDVVLSRQELTVGNVVATVAQGSVSGKLVVNLKQPERSWFQFDLASAELTDLLHPWPALAEHAQGTVDVRLHGTLGKEWAGSADVVLQRGKVLGIDISEWRAPVRWAFHSGEGRWEAETRDSNAQIAQGRATAQASATWNSGLRLNSQIQFVGVNLHQAFPGTRVGTGRATGRIDVSSEHLQTIDDLQANLTATVQHTQALDYPVLRQVAPLLGMTTTKTFESGELRARLTKSVVHIEKLALTEGPWQLFAQGNVTLQGGVHLDMTASTGKLGSLAAALGWRVPQTGTIASEILARATTALSPQLVHVHVRGTVREPTVQVVPLPLLTEQALRFFAGM